MPDIYLVKNTSGATIPRGRAVYVSGATDGVLKVRFAQANSASTLPCLGLTDEEIADGDQGRVIASGELLNIDTSQFSLGSKLYLSEAIQGALTALQPSDPNVVQIVAYVKKVGLSDGVLEIVQGEILGTGTALAAHASSHEVGGSDPIDGQLDANARVGIEKNGLLVGIRRTVNFIEGSNIALSMSDQVEKVNVTVTSTASGGGGTQMESHIFFLAEAGDTPI